MQLSRRTLTRGIAGAGLGAGLVGGLTGRGAFAAQDGFQSGGIGVRRADWEDIYGPGEAYQAGVEYRNVRSQVTNSPIYLRFDNGYVAFIETHWEATQLGGLTQEDARAEVRDLLPADAKLQDIYYLPPTPGGKIGLRAYQWESRSLAEVTVARTAILVVYQEIGPRQITGSGEMTVVTAASIAIASPRQ